MSAGGGIFPLETNPTAVPVRHPNRPVLPFATPTKKASFIDPTVWVRSGPSVLVGFQTYIAPYVTLDASRNGAIKIGNASTVLDSAQLIADPRGGPGGNRLLIGNNVAIGAGARILGASAIGSYSDTAAATSIGNNAVIDGATIEPGAIVSGLARVGPGVTVPSGYRVLPGANVTNDAQASNPALGKVVKVTSADLASVKATLTYSVGLAAGYTKLYQGDSATGVNPGADPSIGGIYNGDLAQVEGVSKSPGPSYVGGTKALSPAFPTPQGDLIGADLFNFPGRIIGAALFSSERAGQLVVHLGRANSIRADVGQPILISSIARTGEHVVIGAPTGGSLAIGQQFRAGDGAVVLGTSGLHAVIGDDVAIGAHSVVIGTSMGTGSTVGADAYLKNSTFQANTHIPPGAIYVNNVFQGYVQSP